ncbi:MAG: hypothetical protein JNJ88_16215 [Planctomycetes bacterium]|nr:hypothetical protein [Planctomycetota bacterium]
MKASIHRLLVAAALLVVGFGSAACESSTRFVLKKPVADQALLSYEFDVVFCDDAAAPYIESLMEKPSWATAERLDFAKPYSREEKIKDGVWSDLYTFRVVDGTWRVDDLTPRAECDVPPSTAWTVMLVRFCAPDRKFDRSVDRIPMSQLIYGEKIQVGSVSLTLHVARKGEFVILKASSQDLQYIPS